MDDTGSTSPPRPPRATDRVLARLHHVYPGRLLSALMYHATRIRYARFKNWQIRWFIHRYGIDMDDALEPDPAVYPDFNAFFTRELRARSRPVASAARDIVSPVDGAVSEIGDVTEGRLPPVKGRGFTLPALLGGDRDLFDLLDRGKYATLYLAPQNYHRVHMPVAGRLVRMSYVPGALFSVAPSAASVIPGLLARNERVLMRFETERGPMALIMVGALFVGNIETVWAGRVTPSPGHRARAWRYDPADPALSFERGREVARFNMGSTVVLLFPPGRMQWDPDLRPGEPVRMGSAIGRWNDR